VFAAFAVANLTAVVALACIRRRPADRAAARG
jgi:hypothetical protein